MKAPDIIYMPEVLLDESWTKKEEDTDICYLRKDAFIEKACAWLEGNLLDYWSQKNAAPYSFIEDFKNYLKKRIKHGTIHRQSRCCGGDKKTATLHNG